MTILSSRNSHEMVTGKTWKIKKHWLSEIGWFLRNPTGDGWSLFLIKGYCGISFILNKAQNVFAPKIRFFTRPILIENKGQIKAKELNRVEKGKIPYARHYNPLGISFFFKIFTYHLVNRYHAHNQSY